MITAPIPEDDKQRLSELHYYNILDSEEEEDYDEIVLLASQICGTPISTITLIDASRQWHKAKTGLLSREGGRDISFCGHTILNGELMEVANAVEDERFSDNPLVTGHPNIRFYAGVPLVNNRGYKLGTLCVIDVEPKMLDEHKKFALQVLGKQTVKLMELRVKNREAELAADIQKKIMSVMAHDIRSPLVSIQSVLEMQENNIIDEGEASEMRQLLGKNIDRTLNMVSNLIEWGKIQMKVSSPSHTLVNIKALAEECIQQTKLNADLKKNIFLNNIDEDLNLYIDKYGIEFILRNLLVNANKYTENGAIALHQYKHDGIFYFTVQDSGVGIEMNKIHVILDDTHHYFSKGTRNEQGSGLGLKLVRDYLRRTGDELNITSAPGKGTAVSFSIKAVS